MPQTLLEMAKDLVLAQIQAKTLPPDEMHQALQQTYTSLLALKTQEDAHGRVAVLTPKIPLKPIPWRKSPTKHTVTCLECGAHFKQLSVRHLKEHGLDGRSYRVKYGIPRTQP
jgi:predicted transcriptional regulator